MSKTTEVYLKSAAAGVITGGLAFLAVRSMSRRHHFGRKTTAKAFKTIGSLMDML